MRLRIRLSGIQGCDMSGAETGARQKERCRSTGGRVIFVAESLEGTGTPQNVVGVAAQ